jgi:hypothetical protein
VSNKDPRFRSALALAHKVAADVPQSYDYEAFSHSLWAPELTLTGSTSFTKGEEKKSEKTTGSAKSCADMDEMPGLAKLLVDEIHGSVFYRPGKSKPGKSVLSRSQRWNVSNFQATDIDSCHLILDKKSPYRKGLASIESSYGLCNEVRVWKSFIEHNIGCPECGCKDLLLGGGSAAAWGDIACSQCPTLLEIKSYADGGVKRAKKGYMYGGSYRWFKAQEKKKVHHYAVVAPSGETDGHVMLYKISHVQPDISAKFMAYFNDLPKRARFGTLAKLVLPGRELFWNDKISTTKFRGQCDALSNTVATLFFQHHARTMQRCVRKWLGGVDYYYKVGCMYKTCDESERKKMEKLQQEEKEKEKEKVLNEIVKRKAQEVKEWASAVLWSAGFSFTVSSSPGLSSADVYEEEHDFECLCETCYFLEEEEVYSVKYDRQQRKTCTSRRKNQKMKMGHWEWVDEQKEKW